MSEDDLIAKIKAVTAKVEDQGLQRFLYENAKEQARIAHDNKDDELFLHYAQYVTKVERFYNGRLPWAEKKE